MKQLIFAFLLFSFFAFSQEKDYKSFDKAVDLFNKGEVQKAKTILDKCIAKNPAWEKPYQLLGNIFENEGEYDLAIENYLKGFEGNNPEDKMWWQRIADMCFSHGMYDRALYFYQSFVAFDSTEEEVFNKAKKHIQDCNFALQALKNPLAFAPINMGKNINTELEEYLPSLSTDGKKLFITRKIQGDIEPQEDFYYSEKSDDGIWTMMKPMGFVNTPTNEGAFAISADEKKAVFTACGRKDSYGSCDLYLINYENKKIENLANLNSKYWDTQGCFSPDGRFFYFVSNRPGGFGGKDIWISEITNEEFGTPYNAGPTINTIYNEMSPFLHTDNLTFYFASDGHIGMGDFDLFVCRREYTSQAWGMPENLGYPINTFKIENSLVVAQDGKTAYFTSDNSGFGKEDIFYFFLPKEMQAQPISAFELDIISKNVGAEIVLENVYFDNNSFQLSSNSYSELENLVAYLHKNQKVSIEIQGHTDNVGNETDNQLLSEQRAQSVYAFLVSKNISASRLAYKGFGESVPILSNESAEGRKTNRRTSFRIIN